MTFTVLSVEDDPKIAEIHQHFTEKVAGFEVVGIALNLADAEKMSQLFKPDLVLLDYYFPDGHGTDVLWRIRGERLATDIIMITAAKEGETLQEAIRGGIFDYIVNPTGCGSPVASLQGKPAGGTGLAKRDRSPDPEKNPLGLCRPTSRGSECRAGQRSDRHQSNDRPTLPGIPGIHRPIARRTGVWCGRSAGAPLFQGQKRLGQKDPRALKPVDCDRLSPFKPA
ncbi:MAG: response regulator [Desulfuromonadales bacterium]